VYVADAPSDVRTRYPEQARAEGIVSALAVGMLCRGRPVGVIRAYTSRPHRFSRFEVSLLRALAAQSAAAIVNARLYREAREAERWARQIRHAGDIQRRMIPTRPPERSGFALGTAYAPSFEVGGDFYDFIELPSGHVGLAIADVMGKGLPAALMMASLRSALRVYARTLGEIDKIVARVNNHFHRDTLVSEFATAVYGVLAPDGRTFTYCNAGHNPPVLLRDRTVHALETGGMVLGVRHGEHFKKETVPLRPDDVLLLYTDGVLDALNFAGENFGYDRMIRSLVAKAAMPAPLIAHDLLWDVRRFVGLAPQADDLTVVAVKVL
jgi:sigma-B regulation protein RsbU (phosphoserine phosphatase)